MNNRLYSHLYSYIKNIFALKKPSAFANLLMEKPGNSFAIAEMSQKYLKKKNNLRGKPASLPKALTPGHFLVPASTNQPSGFSVSRTSTLNKLFQTIKNLK